MDLSYLQKPNKQLITSCFFLVGLLILIYGITNYNDSDSNFVPIKATIVSSSCMPTQTPKMTTNKICSISVVYKVDDKTYKTQIRRDDDYDIGDTITIYYNKSDPSDVSLDSKQKNNINLFFVIFGILIFCLTMIYTLFFDKKTNSGKTPKS